MVLLIAVALGLISGLIRSKLFGKPYQPVDIRYAWLAIVAYIPQFFAFYLPATRSVLPESLIPFFLVGSQILLLIFVWLNRGLPGFWLLGLGLLLNFLAISLNGGLMPLQPENAAKLIPAGDQITLHLGHRVGFGKDILLEKSATRLWFLGDIFLLPEVFKYPLAFSIGDIVICAGAFWLLWSPGSPRKNSKEVSP